jgi:hypothetical protein
MFRVVTSDGGEEEEEAPGWANMGVEMVGSILPSRIMEKLGSWVNRVRLRRSAS